jgi:hypothetical protein
MFLSEDGNYQQAEEFFARTVEIMEILKGGEHYDTIRAMSNLAVAYRVQGKWNNAQRL